MLPGKKFSFNSQGGQVFLIVVLIMFIGLTVGLSVASRSVTNLKSSLEEENSQRAFAAAEAGVEKALKNLTVPSGTPFGEGNTAIQRVTIDSITGLQDIQLNNNTLISKDDGGDIWLTNTPNNPLSGTATTYTGDINIYWGDAACPNTAALEVIVFLKSSGIPVSKRYVYEPCPSARATMSSPAVTGSSGGTILGRNYSFSTGNIQITEGYIARVIPLYFGSYIAVHGSTAFPDQGKTISSVGTSGSTSRKVTYYQGHPKIPNEIFQYVLFQPN